MLASVLSTSMSKDCRAKWLRKQLREHRGKYKSKESLDKLLLSRDVQFRQQKHKWKMQERLKDNIRFFYAFVFLRIMLLNNLTEKLDFLLPECKLQISPPSFYAEFKKLRNMIKKTLQRNQLNNQGGSNETQ